MRFCVLLTMLLCLTACTVTDEQTQALDVTPPNFSVAVNGNIAYSSFSQHMGPITCDDGSVPTFVQGSGTYPGITVPLDENAGLPIYPIEINILAGDPSGIASIRSAVPPGLVWSADTTPTFNNSENYSYVNKWFSAPLTTSENMTFSYSRVDTPYIAFSVMVYDGAANANVKGLTLDIAPESEVCP